MGRISRNNGGYDSNDEGAKQPSVRNDQQRQQPLQQKQQRLEDVPSEYNNNNFYHQEKKKHIAGDTKKSNIITTTVVADDVVDKNTTYNNGWHQRQEREQDQMQQSFQGSASTDIAPPRENGYGLQQQQQQIQPPIQQGHHNTSATHDEEEALDAYVVEPQKRPRKRNEVIQGVVEQPTSTNRMSTRTIVILTLIGAALIAGVTFVAIFLALREKEPTTTETLSTTESNTNTTVVVIVETDPPDPTTSPTSAPPTTQPSLSMHPSSSPTSVPTSENYAVFSMVLELLYDVIYEDLELDLSDRNSPQAQAAAWMSNEDQFLQNSFDAGELNIDFVYEFAERYSLAVFYFATTSGDGSSSSWTDQCNFLNPQTHVCDWKCPLPQAVLDGDINPMFGDGDLTDLIGLTGTEMGVFCVKDILDDSTGIESLWESVLRLHLVFNGLQGSIPDELIQGLQIVLDYNFAFNELTGTIPWPYFPTDLVFFVAPGNRLSGTLPAEIGRLTNLDTLQIGSNLISGTIPNEIQMMTSLQFLYMEDTILEGEIPDALGDIIGSIFYLNLEFNFLSGPLKPLLFRSNGVGVSLAENILTGTFPDIPFSSFGYPIEGFDLRNNSLTGTLPESIGRLTSLQAASFAGNAFTGSLPDSFSSLSSLQILRLDENQFTGNAMEGDIFGNMNFMIFWMMHDNNFSGTINGAIFQNMPILETAIFSRNAFEGSIPSEIGNTRNLVDLHLDDNNLSGQIPMSIQNLLNLQTLRLNLNSLTGNLERNCVQAEFLLESGQILLPVFDFAADCPDEVVCSCCTQCCDANDVCTSQ